MTEDQDATLERRIRERAFQIWVEENKPEGRDRDHWQLAKLAIAQEDNLSTTLAPAPQLKQSKRS